MVDNSQMGFIISDQEKNIIVYKYQPEQRESLGGNVWIIKNILLYLTTSYSTEKLYLTFYSKFSGQRLLRKADFHIGQCINSFFRICCKKSTLSEERREQLNSNKRHITMYGQYKKFIPVYLFYRLFP